MRDFINTVIGSRICSLSESALKKFNSKNVAITVKSVDVESKINEYAQNGMNYVDHIVCSDDWITLIFK